MATQHGMKFGRQSIKTVPSRIKLPPRAGINKILTDFLQVPVAAEGMRGCLGAHLASSRLHA